MIGDRSGTGLGQVYVVSLAGRCIRLLRRQKRVVKVRSRLFVLSEVITLRSVTPLASTLFPVVEVAGSVVLSALNFHPNVSTLVGLVAISL
jgi:hypothetical protein